LCPVKVEAERPTGALWEDVVRMENDTSSLSAPFEEDGNEGCMTNINEPLILCPIPTAAHPVPGAGKRAERWRERSFDKVVSLWDELRAKQRSVVLEGSMWQNCVEDETEAAENPEIDVSRRSDERTVDLEGFILMG
jgi:hypothetical protein